LVAWWREFSTKSQLRFLAKRRDLMTSNSRFPTFIWCSKRESVSKEFLRPRLKSANKRPIRILLPWLRESCHLFSIMRLSANVRKPVYQREPWLHKRLLDFSRERLVKSWIILREVTLIFICKDSTCQTTKETTKM
jgi:hypothetical protein